MYNETLRASGGGVHLMASLETNSGPMVALRVEYAATAAEHGLRRRPQLLRTSDKTAALPSATHRLAQER